MLGQEVRIPDQLIHGVPDVALQPTQKYVLEVQGRLQTAHNLLREQQRQVRTQDSEAPPLFKKGDLVWLVNKRRKKGQKPKLQPKFVGPYHVLSCYPNHTYYIERKGQGSVQHESRLKLHRPCSDRLGQAPVLIEPRRRANMKGATK